jgi:hypothetical protein
LQANVRGLPGFNNSNNDKYNTQNNENNPKDIAGYSNRVGLSYFCTHESRPTGIGISFGDTILDSIPRRWHHWPINARYRR